MALPPPLLLAPATALRESSGPPSPAPLTRCSAAAATACAGVSAAAVSGGAEGACSPPCAPCVLTSNDHALVLGNPVLRELFELSKGLRSLSW